MLSFVMMSSQVPTLARGAGKVGVLIDKCISHCRLILATPHHKVTFKNISRDLVSSPIFIFIGVLGNHGLTVDFIKRFATL